jgi:hypothetical protein
MTWICPKCERELRNENQWHNCVKVSIDSLFAGKKEELILVFDKLLAVIADWDDLTMGATQNCIVFVHHQTFLIIKPMTKALNLKFYSATQQEGLPIIKSTAYSGRFENHIGVADVSDLTPAVFSYIRASYQLL